MTLTEKLDHLMQEKSINRRQLSSQSGIPYMTIVNFYEKGTENVKLSTLKKLAYYFHVSLDYIADDSVEIEDSCLSLPDTECAKQKEELMQNFTSLNSEGRKELLHFSEYLISSGKYAARNEDAG